MKKTIITLGGVLVLLIIGYIYHINTLKEGAEAMMQGQMDAAKAEAEAQRLAQLTQGSAVSNAVVAPDFESDAEEEMVDQQALLNAQGSGESNAVVAPEFEDRGDDGEVSGSNIYDPSLDPPPPPRYPTWGEEGSDAMPWMDGSDAMPVDPVFQGQGGEPVYTNISDARAKAVRSSPEFAPPRDTRGAISNAVSNAVSYTQEEEEREDVASVATGSPA